MPKEMPPFNKDHYKTPDHIWKAVLKLTDKSCFNLDACTDQAPNVLSVYQYTQNSLTSDWGRNLVYKFMPGGDWCNESSEWHVWMNPPYSEIEAWIRKAINESYKGSTIWALIPLRNNQFYQDVIHQYASWRLALRRRISFLHPETLQPISGNREPSELVVFGDPNCKHYFKALENGFDLDGELYIGAPRLIRNESK